MIESKSLDEVKAAIALMKRERVRSLKLNGIEIVLGRDAYAPQAMAPEAPDTRTPEEIEADRIRQEERILFHSAE